MLNLDHIREWFHTYNWEPFKFQEDTWEAFLAEKNGLVNAPTGSGKTYSLLIPIILSHYQLSKREQNGLSAIWITPIRALAKEILISAERIIKDLDLDFSVEIRSGDTSTKVKAAQRKKLPNLLITTPESLHILMSQKNYSVLFKNCFCLVADEWHELLGSKRGVQIELALSKIAQNGNAFRKWGISATVGNVDQAAEVLLGADYKMSSVLISANIEKVIEVKSILPKEVEKFPWGGHLGINLAKQVIPIITNSESTLIFTNTRAQCEIWYQKLLEICPELSGIAALHHGSLSKSVRFWVEDALQNGDLKVVVCTSSLDLGVDFTPVETIIQIGGPKGIARFVQRAGRSGHRPGAKSVIHFLPTHSLELIEAAALREAIKNNFIERREPYVRSFDVLLQYLMTLAVGEGFNKEDTFSQVKSCYSYYSLSEKEWESLIGFLQNGGASLGKYEEFKKTVTEDGLIKVVDRRMVRRHKMSIGTIVSDGMMKIKFKRGGYIGTIEERFIVRLNEGDVFWFAGKCLELIEIRQMTAIVVKSSRSSKLVPAYRGGSLPISSNMSEVIRAKLDQYISGKYSDIELKTIAPLLEFQRERSFLPTKNECLIEYFTSDQGYHLLVYPFEGKFVNEGIASLLAYRISKVLPITFSLAFNDYGLELLSDQKIDVSLLIKHELFSSKNLFDDIQQSINGTEMARRRFRDIASISGLVFKGFPGENIKDRHLQSSSDLFFDVFTDYDSNNLLLLQSFEESMTHQLEYERLRIALQRIENQYLVIKYPDKPTPFAFPIMVNRLREKLSSETLGSRIKRMNLQYE